MALRTSTIFATRRTLLTSGRPPKPWSVARRLLQFVCIYPVHYPAIPSFICYCAFGFHCFQEMVADAYDSSRNQQYKEQLLDLFAGFIVQYGLDWSSSPYNDDIMWMVLASLRVHNITGNTDYLKYVYLFRMPG